MPLPEKQQGESKSEFIVRCMADDVMVDEFTDRGQRLAVCINQLAEDGDAPEGE